MFNKFLIEGILKGMYTVFKVVKGIYCPFEGNIQLLTVSLLMFRNIDRETVSRFLIHGIVYTMGFLITP